MGRPIQSYSEEEADDWRIYPVGLQFRSSEIGLATYRTASETFSEEEPERLRAKRLQV